MTDLDPKRFGLAAGIIWGATLFVLTLALMATGYAALLLNAIAGIYIGYSVSAVGSVIGLIYGFIDAFIGCYIFVWLYNWLENKV